MEGSDISPPLPEQSSLNKIGRPEAEIKPDAKWVEGAKPVITPLLNIKEVATCFNKRIATMMAENVRTGNSEVNLERQKVIAQKLQKLKTVDPQEKATIKSIEEELKSRIASTDIGKKLKQAEQEADERGIKFSNLNMDDCESANITTDSKAITEQERDKANKNFEDAKQKLTETDIGPTVLTAQVYQEVCSSIFSKEEKQPMVGSSVSSASQSSPESGLLSNLNVRKPDVIRAASPSPDVEELCEEFYKALIKESGQTGWSWSNGPVVELLLRDNEPTGLINILEVCAKKPQIVSGFIDEVINKRLRKSEDRDKALNVIKNIFDTFIFKANIDPESVLKIFHAVKAISVAQNYLVEYVVDKIQSNFKYNKPLYIDFLKKQWSPERIEKIDQYKDTYKGNDEELFALELRKKSPDLFKELFAAMFLDKDFNQALADYKLKQILA